MHDMNVCITLIAVRNHYTHRVIMDRTDMDKLNQTDVSSLSSNCLLKNIMKEYISGK
jgi:hypothetical protein